MISDGKKAGKDQLKVIFDVLGHQDENDLSFVNDPKFLEYANSFNNEDL